VETAAALALKAAGTPHDALLALCAHLHAGTAAREVASTGVRLLRASGQLTRREIEEWKAETRHAHLLATAENELEALDEAVRLIAQRWGRFPGPRVW
jgi:hypothetical protein